MNNYEDIIANIDNKAKEFREYSKNQMTEIYKSVFESFPNIAAIVWTQYAPYFNDGEPCEFSVHDVNIVEKSPHFDFDPDLLVLQGCAYGELDYDGEYEESDLWCTDGWGLSSGTPLKLLIDTLDKFHSGISGLMEDIYGSHAIVAVTPEKTIVEEYEDHD